MAACRPYLEKVEESSMAARKSGRSEDYGVSQALKELAETIGKAMGHSAELSNVVPGLVDQYADGVNKGLRCTMI